MAEHDDAYQTIYCEEGDDIIGYPIESFLLLAKGSCYFVRSIGSAEYVKLFYHIHTKQVYGLFGNDSCFMCEEDEVEIDECIAHPLDINVEQAFKLVHEYAWYTTYEESYRKWKIDQLLTAINKSNS